MVVYDNELDYYSLDELKEQKASIIDDLLSYNKEYQESKNLLIQAILLEVPKESQTKVMDIFNKVLLEKLTYFCKIGLKDELKPKPRDKSNSKELAKLKINNPSKKLDSFYKTCVVEQKKIVLSRKRFFAIDQRIAELEKYPDIWKTVKELSTILQIDHRKIPLRTLLLDAKNLTDDDTVNNNPQISTLYKDLTSKEKKDFNKKRKQLKSKLDTIEKKDRIKDFCGIDFLPETVGRDVFFKNLYSSNKIKMAESIAFNKRWNKESWDKMSLIEKSNYLDYINQSKNATLTKPEKFVANDIKVALPKRYKITYNDKRALTTSINIYNDQIDYFPVKQLDNLQKLLTDNFLNQLEGYQKLKALFIQNLSDNTSSTEHRDKAIRYFERLLIDETKYGLSINYRDMKYKHKVIDLSKDLKPFNIKNPEQTLLDFYVLVINPINKIILSRLEDLSIKKRVTELENYPNIWKTVIELSTILQGNDKIIPLRTLLLDAKNPTDYDKVKNNTPISTLYKNLKSKKKQRFNDIREHLKSELDAVEKKDDIKDFCGMDFLPETVENTNFFNRLYLYNKINMPESSGFNQRWIKATWDEMSLIEKSNYLDYINQSKNTTLTKPENFNATMHLQLNDNEYLITQPVRDPKDSFAYQCDYFSKDQLEGKKNELDDEFDKKNIQFITSKEEFTTNLLNKLPQNNHKEALDFFDKLLKAEVSYTEGLNYNFSNNIPRGLSEIKELHEKLKKYGVQNPEQVLTDFYTSIVTPFKESMTDRYNFYICQNKINELKKYNFPNIWETVKELSTILQKDNEQISLRTLLLDAKNPTDYDTVKDDTPISTQYNTLKPEEKQKFNTIREQLKTELDTIEEKKGIKDFCGIDFLPETTGKALYFRELYAANKKIISIQKKQYNNLFHKNDWKDMSLLEKANFINFINRSNDSSLITPKSSYIHIKYRLPEVLKLSYGFKTNTPTPPLTSELIIKMSGEAMNRPDKPRSREAAIEEPYESRRNRSEQATQKRQQSNEPQYGKQLSQ